MTEAAPNLEFDALLNFLRRSRGFRFDSYKRPSLMRRIARCMQQADVETYADYVDYLEVHPEGFAQLFNTILINVTDFFRDRPAWDYLRTEIIPRIVATKKPTEAIRAWCAGVASGQEAFSLAMLFCEALGEEKYRQRVKIYATDLDEDALNVARLATYEEKQVAEIPPELLAKYFEKVDSHYVFKKSLRRSVIFGRHDLFLDAPISRIDLLVCRNTLMYFNAEAQARILSNFHYALNESGFLFLGKSEMLLTRNALFSPVDLKRRIFLKVDHANPRERLLAMLPAGDPAPNGQPATNHARLREAAADVAPVAQIIVDASGNLASANQAARALFGLAAADVGGPLQDFELSFRPVELRSLIERASVEIHPVISRDVEWGIGAETRYVDVQVLALSGRDGARLGTSITFTDVTRYHRLQDELLRSKQELETAYEELQAANEELETTNEELQSTNEELETTNEELQATNEELETMNEELQSTNEELQTTNDELRARTTELNEVNAFLESILTSLRVGVAVLDRDLRITSWNHRSEDLWGLRLGEVQGSNFLNLDVGLPVDQLRQPIRSCLSGEQTEVAVTLPAINRRGRSIDCRVAATALRSADGAPISGVVLIFEELPRIEEGDERR